MRAKWILMWAFLLGSQSLAFAADKEYSEEYTLQFIETAFHATEAIRVDRGDVYFRLYMQNRGRGENVTLEFDISDVTAAGRSMTSGGYQVTMSCKKAPCIRLEDHDPKGGYGDVRLLSGLTFQGNDSFAQLEKAIRYYSDHFSADAVFDDEKQPDKPAMLKTPDTVASPSKLVDVTPVDRTRDLKAPDTVASPSKLMDVTPVDRARDPKAPDTVASPSKLVDVTPVDRTRDLKAPDTVASPSKLVDITPVDRTRDPKTPGTVASQSKLLDVTPGNWTRDPTAALGTMANPIPLDDTTTTVPQQPPDQFSLACISLVGRTFIAPAKDPSSQKPSAPVGSLLLTLRNSCRVAGMVDVEERVRGVSEGLGWGQFCFPAGTSLYLFVPPDWPDLDGTTAVATNPDPVCNEHARVPGKTSTGSSNN